MKKSPEQTHKQVLKGISISLFSLHYIFISFSTQKVNEEGVKKLNASNTQSVPDKSESLQNQAGSQ